VKLEDKDKDLFHLNSLPNMFELFKEALLFGKEQTITLKDVHTSVRTREIQKLQESKASDGVDQYL